VASVTDFFKVRSARFISLYQGHCLLVQRYTPSRQRIRLHLDPSESQKKPDEISPSLLVHHSNSSFIIPLHFELHSSISSISEDTWDACHSSSPFLKHSWIRCLEESNCASRSTGWVPQHVSIRIGKQLVGYVPLYIKEHSLGEFVFDQSWAEAAYRNRIDYYPKLLSGIPFTPATGDRILWMPSVSATYCNSDLSSFRGAVGEFLRQLAITNKLSSVHINFLRDEEATALAGGLDQVDTKLKSLPRSMQSLLESLKGVKDDYIRRTSLQYHWCNRNPNNSNMPYDSFDDYLRAFKSKRRIAIRRERSSVREDQGIRIDTVSGEEIRRHPGLVARMFDIYLATIQKMSFWGRQYLTLEFFELLVRSDFCKHLCFICARHNSTGAELKAEDVFAGTISE
jgi:uncharacterized protein